MVQLTLNGLLQEPISILPKATHTLEQKVLAISRLIIYAAALYSLRKQSLRPLIAAFVGVYIAAYTGFIDGFMEGYYPANALLHQTMPTWTDRATHTERQQYKPNANITAQPAEPDLEYSEPDEESEERMKAGKEKNGRVSYLPPSNEDQRYATRPSAAPSYEEADAIIDQGGGGGIGVMRPFTRSGQRIGSAVGSSI